MHVGVITNPNSRKNRGRARRAHELQQIIGNYGEVYQTTSPDSLKPILREFLRRKVQYWVSDGGDGALHWMLRNGLEVLSEEEFAGHELPLALPTNGGTIDFVAHNVGIRGNAESLLCGLRHRLERREPVEVAEVKAMRIDAVDFNGEAFTTIGFAAAVGGIGQRFFSKFYACDDPRPSQIVKVVAKAVGSYPVANTALSKIPGMPRTLRTYAKEVFKPTAARLTIDGRQLPNTECTGIHIASMSIDLGGVMRFFGLADQPGQLHAIAGSPPTWQIIRNIPRMYLGKQMIGDDLYDGPCREMIVEAASDEPLAPVIDGEYYENLRKITFSLGPRFRIARVEGRRPN